MKKEKLVPVTFDREIYKEKDWYVNKKKSCYRATYQLVSVEEVLK